MPRKKSLALDALPRATTATDVITTPGDLCLLDRQNICAALLAMDW